MDDVDGGINNVADKLSDAFDARDRYVRKLVEHLAPRFVVRDTNVPFDEFLSSNVSSGLTIADVLLALHGRTVYWYDPSLERSGTPFTLVPVDAKQTAYLTDVQLVSFLGFYREEPDTRIGVVYRARDPWYYKSNWAEFYGGPMADYQ
jgi:hypothetical protein